MLPAHRVLIADDDLEVRRCMADLLGTFGLQTVQAETGPEALEIFRLRRTRGGFDLLLLDMHMPGCTGLDVLVDVRRESDVPCIFYSGNATLEIERRALEAGALAFLHKPVPPKTLKTHVLRALAGATDGPLPGDA